jgi:hypothetical protein
LSFTLFLNCFDDIAATKVYFLVSEQHLALSPQGNVAHKEDCKVKPEELSISTQKSIAREFTGIMQTSGFEQYTFK